MKRKKDSHWISLGVALIALASATPIFATEREGGNGSDRVEVLFLKAQRNASATVDLLQPARIATLPIGATFKTWLSTGNNLSQLQLYTRAMKLVFKDEDEPCLEEGFPRGACYGWEDAARTIPVMYVSRSLNQKTSPLQAQAMVIHEAGHFAGETDHVFLSALGTELAGRLKDPFSDFVSTMLTDSKCEKRWGKGMIAAYVSMRDNSGTVGWGARKIKIKAVDSARKVIYPAAVEWMFDRFDYSPESPYYCIPDAEGYDCANAPSGQPPKVRRWLSFIDTPDGTYLQESDLVDSGKVFHTLLQPICLHGKN